MFSLWQSILSFVVTKSTSHASSFQELHLYTMQSGNF
uniref:Uncharacterized protein n=1 Tax=Elaeophora elaphi TaxID=1147741 RepID=A0A0R3S557_9BILA